MAHFALIDSGNIVRDVIVIANDDCGGGDCCGGYWLRRLLLRRVLLRRFLLGGGLLLGGFLLWGGGLVLFVKKWCGGDVVGFLFLGGCWCCVVGLCFFFGFGGVFCFFLVFMEGVGFICFFFFFGVYANVRDTGISPCR